MSELSRDLTLGRGTLGTSGGSYPITILGEGKILSRAPLYAEDLNTRYLVYATQHETHYGNPAHWFGVFEQVMPLLDIEEICIDTPDDIVAADIALRRVSIFEGRVSVDVSGLAVYHFDDPMHDDQGKYLIIPDGYV